MRIHLDTDLGSDIDDACALAMLLGWPDVELTGITTCIDPGGRRAGFVARLLRLAGRDDIPVAAGAGVSMTTMSVPGDIPPDERYWGEPIPPGPCMPGAGVDLLSASIDRGATLVAIGPYTNLAVLEILWPGRLAAVPVVLMGGWIGAPAEKLPAWGPEADWNVQCDTRAAAVVAGAASDLTLVPLATTARVHLRAADLPRLEAAGPLGKLLARQARAHGGDHHMKELGARYAGLPDDLLNFQHDPLACAVAAGWDGTRAEHLVLEPAYEDGVMRFERDSTGRPATVIVDADGVAFQELWLQRVEAAARQGHGRPY